MVAFVQACGHDVLSAHVAHAEVLHAEAQLSPQEIFTRDVRMIEAGEAVIAEVSRPSLGVGYEIALALELRKPVLCLCEKEIFLTRMLTGNTARNLKIVFYSTDEEWQRAISAFCDHLKQD
jgi:hypothetical protein